MNTQVHFTGVRPGDKGGTPALRTSFAMRMRSSRLLPLALAVIAAPLCAAPAPYYLWMSQLDGTRVCSQISLGPGWERVGGPFQDSRCRKPL